MGSKRAGPLNKRWLGKQAVFYSFKRQYFENGRRYSQSYYLYEVAYALSIGNKIDDLG